MTRCIDAVHYIPIVGVFVSDRQRCIRQGPIAKRSRVRCTRNPNLSRGIINNTTHAYMSHMVDTYMYTTRYLDPLDYDGDN